MRLCLFRSYLAIFLTGLGCLSCFATAAENIPGYISVPLGRGRQNHLLIHTLIKGRKVVLAVDSGAPVSVLDASMAGRLWLSAPKRESGVPNKILSGDKTMNVVWLPDFQAGAMKFGAGPMAIFQGTGMPNMYYRNSNGTVDGLLGWDILRHYQAILDCRGQQLLFKINPKASSPLSGSWSLAGYHGVKMTEHDGHLFIACQFKGRNAELIVDTGSYITLLDLSQVHARGLNPTPTGMMAGGTSYQSTSVGVLDPERHQITIGGIPICQPVGVFDVSPGGSHPALGFLGSDVMGLQGAIIDFEKMMFYFHEPRKKFSKSS